MPLRIKSFRIQNFKAIGDATLHWHPRINIITGPNNSGKTTVLEALSLWVTSFYRICSTAGKASTKLGVRRGQQYLRPANVHHSEVISIRSPNFHDLFHRDAKELFLTATFEDEDGTFSIPIKIREARGSTYEFSCTASGPTLHRRLNDSSLSWPRPFHVIFASPIAALQTTEEFLSPGKIDDIVRRRRSAEVLRNRLFRLHARATEFQQFNDNVGYILNGSHNSFNIQVSGNSINDVLVRATARTSANDRLRDISLLGSGSLQIIEILLNLYLDASDLNLVLLDEPDSHIHRDIQRRLLEIIEQKTQHTQVFATTHNESMLRNTSWDRVFHLMPAPADKEHHFRPIASTHVINRGRQRGLLASPLRSAMSSIGAETALDLLNALECEHFLLVEGASDAALLDRIFKTNRLGSQETAMYWSLNGIENLRSLPALRVVLSEIRNNQTLWGKARLILDRDWLTNTHSRKLIDAFFTQQHKKGTETFGLRVSFWDAYTAEAVLLSGGPSHALSQMLAKATSSQQPGLDPQRAQRACEQAWVSLGDRLKQHWHGIKNQQLSPVLNQRRELLCELLPKVLPPLSRLLDDVPAFHKQAIDNGEYWHSATKQDVREFIIDALEHMDFTREQAEVWCSGSNWFDALTEHLAHPRDFPALSSMLNDLQAHS